VCGYCSGPHRTSDHKCDIVGCTAKQGALCGHTQVKYPNCRGNHIAFSNRCAKKREVTRAAQEDNRREPAGRTTRGGEAATGTNRITLGKRAEAVGGGDRGWSEEKMADAREEEAGEEDITMGQSATVTTTTKATVMITATSIEPEVEMGAPAATNVKSNPAQLGQVVYMDHGCAPDGSSTEGGHGVSAGTTEREGRIGN